MRNLRIAAFLMFATAFLRASEHRGIVLSGGLPVPGATVIATNGTQRLVSITSEQGIYSFPDLPDGSWNVRVEMLCFAPMERAVNVAPGAASAPWDLKMLPLGEMHSERPAAPAAAPASDAGAGPPATPAASQAADGNAKSQSAKAGVRQPLPPQAARDAESDDLLVNGSVNNGANSANGQAPAFGNFRPPGNHLYSGFVSVDVGNSALDARPFSLTGQNTPKPAYSQTSASAGVGGPLSIPHLWKGNQAPWVYIGYERTRNSTASVADGLMPGPDERSGDFSQSGAVILDPETGLPFPNNRIPATRIGAPAQRLLELYPLPQFASSAGYNYQVSLLGATHQDTFRSNIVKVLHGKEFVFGSFSIGSTRTSGSNVFGFADVNRTHALNGSLGWSRSLGAHWQSFLNIRWNRVTTRFMPYFAGRENISGEAGITGNDQQAMNWGPPNLSFSSGLAALSDGQYSFNRDQTTAVSHSVNWRVRQHTFTFGGEYGRRQYNVLSQQNARGAFTFTGAATGSDLADFLLGIPDTSAIAFGNADKYFRSNTYNAFVKDDWRLATGFSLNFGLRWEYASPVTELYGRLVNLAIAPGFTSATPAPGASPQSDVGLIQPRAAFAWRPSPIHSLVIRGGYGIYADTPDYQGIATQMAQQAPFSKNISVQNTAANPLTLADGFRAAAELAPATFAVDPRFRVGYAQNWQLSIQHGLPGGMVAAADYLGIKGTHARQAVYPNTYPAGAVNPCAACPSGFEYLSSGGSSSRHAAQFRLRRRLHGGLAGSLQYTYAKAIDDATLGGGSQPTLLVAQDWRNLNAERALSTFDQRHLLTLQGQYTTGVGIRGGTLRDGWSGRFFKDWTVSSDVSAGSGLPLTPVYPLAVAGTGFSGSIRPDYTGADLYAAPPGLRLNPAAFAAPALGRWGNAGRDSITGPAQFSLNASMMRTFRLTDRLSADVRIESSNALNHVAYRSWNTVVTSAQFGLPDSANSMRTVRMHLQVKF